MRVARAQPPTGPSCLRGDVYTRTYEGVCAARSALPRSGGMTAKPTGFESAEASGSLCGGLVDDGVCQKRARKNEDRGCGMESPTARRRDGTECEAWADAVLAVYDGHNGGRAADECVRSVTARIGEELVALEEQAGRSDRTQGVAWPTLVRSISRCMAPTHLCRPAIRAPYDFTCAFGTCVDQWPFAMSASCAGRPPRRTAVVATPVYMGFERAAIAVLGATPDTSTKPAAHTA